MRHKKSPSAPSGSLKAGRLSSTFTSSSVSSLLSTSFTSMNTPPSPISPLSYSPPHNAPIIQHCTLPSSPSSSSSFPLPLCKASASKQKSTTCKWVSRFLQLSKPSMDAEDGFLLQSRAPEGLHDDGKLLAEKPKKELRFAAKIAVAMDADGFIGVKNSVCADDALIEVKRNIDSHYCVPCPSSLQRKETPPSKLARPHPRRRWRRWKLFRRIRRTRVLFGCLFQKARKAFTSSSKRTLEARNKFIE